MLKLKNISICPSRGAVLTVVTTCETVISTRQSDNSDKIQTELWPKIWKAKFNKVRPVGGSCYGLLVLVTVVSY